MYSPFYVVPPLGCIFFFIPFYSVQGSRLTFQLPSPVASDRFDSLAKTNFSLARGWHLLL